MLRDVSVHRPPAATVRNFAFLPRSMRLYRCNTVTRWGILRLHCHLVVGVVIVEVLFCVLAGSTTSDGDATSKDLQAANVKSSAASTEYIT